MLPENQLFTHTNAYFTRAEAEMLLTDGLNEYQDQVFFVKGFYTDSRFSSLK
jgi:hypothetical protein